MKFFAPDEFFEDMTQQAKDAREIYVSFINPFNSDSYHPGKLNKVDCDHSQSEVLSICEHINKWIAEERRKDYKKPIDVKKFIKDFHDCIKESTDKGLDIKSSDAVNTIKKYFKI